MCEYVIYECVCEYVYECVYECVYMCEDQRTIYRGLLILCVSETKLRLSGLVAGAFALSHLRPLKSLLLRVYNFLQMISVYINSLVWVFCFVLLCFQAGCWWWKGNDLETRCPALSPLDGVLFAS